MDHAGPAALAFEKAQAAFETGDYRTAVAYAKEAEILVSSAIHARDYGSSSNPTYSIIIVLFADHPDVERALKGIATYSHQYSFEVILVNNGNMSADRFVHGTIERFRWIDVGFNYGCSGGRNLGARAARGEFVIFLDDDGTIGEHAVEHLIEAITQNDAVAVRGRVRAKTPGGIVGSHYDLGENIVCSVPNTEGISVWRRQEFLDYGGFDTLLYGREGLSLWFKMYRFYGPEAFLYTPDAVLWHDFATDDDHLLQKKARLQQGEAYLALSYPNLATTKSLMKRGRTERRTRVLFQRGRYSNAKQAPSGHFAKSQLSVLTFGSGTWQPFADYSRGLKAQTHSNFELIFACNQSNDPSVEKLSNLWGDDRRLRLVKAGGNLAESLNLAVTHASNDICVIADVNDISNPRRLELTVRYLEANREKACIGFATFDEKRSHTIPFPDASSAVRIKVRSLLGMPVSFPTFAFRKSLFSIPADISLSRGYECKWIYENLRQVEVDGPVIPLNQVFHRSGGDYGDDFRWRDVELDCIYWAHAQLYGPLGEKEKLYCRILSDREAPELDGVFLEIQDYILSLIASNAAKRMYDQIQLEEFLLQRLAELDRELLRLKCDKYKRGRDKYKRKLERVWRNEQWPG